MSNDILVGKTDNQTILWSVVLVFILDSETLSSIVVSLALTTSLEFGLEALKVGAILDNFDETHFGSEQLKSNVELEKSKR